MSSSSLVPVFVDLQGFVVGERFIVKEVAVRRGGRVLTHCVFTAPMGWDLMTRAEKSRACWLVANHHGLEWEDGDVEYARARETIRRVVLDGGMELSPLIYVKGAEKKRWLKRIVGDVDASIATIDADYEDIDRLQALTAARPFRCGRHTRNCTMENVCKLHVWWMERNSSLNADCMK